MSGPVFEMVKKSSSDLAHFLSRRFFCDKSLGKSFSSYHTLYSKAIRNAIIIWKMKITDSVKAEADVQDIKFIEFCKARAF